MKNCFTATTRSDKGNKKDQKKVFSDCGRMKSFQEDQVARLHHLVVR